MRNAITKRRRHWWTGALLVLLLFRAYVPVGFMPAAGTPFLLELCPLAGPPSFSGDTATMSASASTPMLGHHHHHPPDAPHRGGAHHHFETCPFGSAPGAGPPCSIAFSSPVQASTAPAVPSESLPVASRLPRAHPARGPPSPA